MYMQMQKHIWHSKFYIQMKRHIWHDKFYIQMHKHIWHDKFYIQMHKHIWHDKFYIQMQETHLAWQILYPNLNLPGYDVCYMEISKYVYPVMYLVGYRELWVTW